ELADDASAAVTADEVTTRKGLGAVGSLNVDLDAIADVAHSGDFGGPPHRPAKLADDVFEDLFGLGLQNVDGVRESAGEHRVVEQDAGEIAKIALWADGQEPIDNPALVEHLDGAWLHSG